MILILLVPQILAFEYSEDIQEQKSFVEITNRVYSTASRLEVNLSLIPETDDRQSSVIQTFPEAEPTPYGILFTFKEKGNLVFGLKSNTTTKFLLKKLNFLPIGDIEKLTNTSELNFYKKSSNYSDSNNPIIKNKAQQIAQKTNNSIEALYLLAEYVHNSMNYDLNYQDLEKASQILEEKKGVCAHYTILFVSLARSLGFPARYISGVAYSGLINQSQEHAWAEVYLPGYGWVPYDTTFGQYAWIDTSHIALKKSQDAGESSVRYSYIKGYIQPEQTSINTQVLDFKEKTPENFETNISIKIELYKEEVSQESYLPVKVKVVNNNNYYISLPIRVSVAPSVYGDSQKILFLEPMSEEEFFFIIYIPYEPECKRGCLTYVSISDSFHDFSKKNITFSDYFDKISLQEAQRIVDEQSITEVDFYCVSNSTIQDENKSVLCNIKPQNQEMLKICYQQDCTEKYFEKDKETQIPFEIRTNESDACFLLDYNNLSLKSCVVFEDKHNKNFFQRIWDSMVIFFMNLDFRMSQIFGFVVS